MAEDRIIAAISAELQVGRGQVARTVALFDEGNTVPFVARYRKEVTGGLDETQLRGVVDGLAFEWLFQFGGEDGQAVEEEGQVEAGAARLAVAELAHDGEAVGFVFALVLGVEAGLRHEVGHVELAASVSNALAQDGDRALAFNLALEPAQQVGARLVAVAAGVALPGLGLGGEDEVEDVVGDEAAGAVVVAGRLR